MALVTRLTRLFRADLHAVLDRVEEPALLLQQAIREMDDAVSAGEQRRKLLEHDLGRIEARQGELNRSLEDIAEELDVCFESGKEDLARKTVRRRLETQRLLELLQARREALAQEHSSITGRLAENRSRLAAMRQKAELLGERDADTGREEPQFDSWWSSANVSVHDEMVEVAFLREQCKRKAP